VHNLGFEGLRFDFSKGYAGEYAGQYARAALHSDQIAIGEFWVPLKYDNAIMVRDQEDNRRQITEWLEASGNRCLAFDFSTKGLLQVGCRCGASGNSVVRHESACA
jgi:alpha-amylase